VPDGGRFVKVSDKSRYQFVLGLVSVCAAVIIYYEIKYSAIQNTIHFNLLGYLIYPILIVGLGYTVYACLRGIKGNEH
jgi:hypothetical protein